MPFYEVHFHKTEDLVGRMVIKADNQDQARTAALEATDKDHDDVIDYSILEDEWIQLGEISTPDEPYFNFGAAYWDTNLNKWRTTKPHMFANEEGTPVGNPKKLGSSVEWAPYEESGDWALPGGPSNRAEDKEWAPPKIQLNVNDTVDPDDLQKCPWCGGDMDHDGDHHGWYADCNNCDGVIELRTILKNIVVNIEPPTEKWTTDLEDFSADYYATSPYYGMVELPMKIVGVKYGDWNEYEGKMGIWPDDSWDEYDWEEAIRGCIEEGNYEILDDVGDEDWDELDVSWVGHPVWESLKHSYEAEEPADPVETPAQMVEQFQGLVRKTMKQMIGIIDELSDPVVLSKTVVKDLIDQSFELGYNSGNIDGKWEMKQEMNKFYQAEGVELETPIVDRAMRLHMMIERATRHAMMVAMEQQALMAMLANEGHWVEHRADGRRTDVDQIAMRYEQYDWTREEFGMIEAKELLEEIGDMEDHLGDLETEYTDALEEDNEDLEYILEEKIIECKEDIEYLIHLLYEVEESQFNPGGIHQHD